MNNRDRKKLKERIKFKLSYFSRLLEFSPKSKSFSDNESNSIGRIYVINLDRKPKRWKQIVKELNRILINQNKSLYSITRRFSAVDARYLPDPINDELLNTKYSLADQLAVEPNSKISESLDTGSLLIDMTLQEIAIALSHIEVWKLISQSEVKYTLILEDDIYFKSRFSRMFDSLWNQINKDLDGEFDILFLSYEYAKNDAEEQKKVSDKVQYFQPTRGIWQASGYILSKKGAQKLLGLMPMHGPVDLWLNLIFDKLNVYITSNPIILQRIDVPSTNSYSIMPVLSKLGIYTGNDQSVFVPIHLKTPIFVFGEQKSGFTAIANALMILGYTCCFNLNKLPKFEYDKFWDKRSRNYFNAYVNIESLEKIGIDKLREIYPDSRIIQLVNTESQKKNELNNNILYISKDSTDKWDDLYQFLDVEYPSIPFPECEDDYSLKLTNNEPKTFNVHTLKFDSLPWIISPHKNRNIETKEQKRDYKNTLVLSKNSNLDLARWQLRNDTFPSNLAIFSSNNINIIEESKLELTFKGEKTSVRSFTSAALATKEKFLYGRFNTELRPTDVDGLITGVFLCRNSPHQEIDIEFLGKDTSKMLVNVFFNPGMDGAKLEYGYRGTPVMIDLGFDASKEFHIYEIQWDKNVIKWYVDGLLVYERGIWSPTPIPCLPMEFNVNLWHSRSKELSGILDNNFIPTTIQIRKIIIEY